MLSWVPCARTKLPLARIVRSWGTLFLRRRLDYLAVEFHIVPLDGFAETAQSDPTPSEVVVDRRFGRFLHVVEIEFDRAILHATDQFDLMPSVVIPGRSRVGLAKRFAWTVVDLQELIGDGVAHQTLMRVVKMLVVLVAEEDAAVSVTSSLEVRTASLDEKHEIAHHEIAKQRKVAGARMRRLVIALSMLIVDLALSRHLGNLPRLGIGGLPIVGPLLEVVGKEQRQAIEFLDGTYRQASHGRKESKYASDYERFFHRWSLSP